jgi:hypothetical protein
MAPVKKYRLVLGFFMSGTGHGGKGQAGSSLYFTRHSGFEIPTLRAFKATAGIKVEAWPLPPNARFCSVRQFTNVQSSLTDPVLEHGAEFRPELEFCG